MAANNGKANKVLRNVAKIQEWDGQNIEDIIDALDVIRANGGSYDLQKNPKSVPDVFEDIADVPDIYAVDAEGNILYMDETVGRVDDIRDRRHREEIGLAPMDDLMDFISSIEKDYQTNYNDEIERITRRGNKTSARSQSFAEVLLVIEKIKGAVNGTADKMEQAISA